LSRSITVADGVFAPGHLGELTRIVPFDMVDAVLEECGAVQRRLRDLPSRVGVYLLLAMGLFEQAGLASVWSKLVAGLSGLPGAAVVAPSEKALRDLRRRIGPEPVKALFGLLAGPLARPGTPGARYRGFRTVAFDGCSSLKVPDHERNRSWLPKVRHRQGLAGYPALMLVALVETGTRGLIGAVFGPAAVGERAYARRLLPLLGPDVLLLNDRGFDGAAFLADVASTGAQFLVRVSSNRRPPLLAVLPDGSYLTRIAGLPLRVVQARVTVTGADGSTVTAIYRLLTTLTCHRTDPAPALVSLYHERWEIESAFFALRHTLLGGRVLRSKDPVGIEQEMWALLALYQVLRIVMVDAAESVHGIDPDRCSFTVALQAARASVVLADGVLADPALLLGVIGRAVLAALLPPRRPRFSARKVKSPISRYSERDTARPPASTAITDIDVDIYEPVAQAKPAYKPRKNMRRRVERAQPAGYRQPALDIMAATPGRPRRARDVARALGISGEAALNSFCVQMSRWSREGRLTKTAPATYMTHQP
jgi:hypothetical protein